MKALGFWLCLAVSSIVPVAAQTLPTAVQDDLAHYLPPGEHRWLTTGNDRYLLLEREALQPLERGVVIHIADWGTHPLQNPIMRTLYQELPRYGWQTFSLQPPLTPLHTDMLQQPPVDERYPTAVGDEVLAPLRAQLRARLQLVMDELVAYSGFVILIAEGRSAALLNQALLADLASDTNLAQPVRPDALIVLNPHLPQYSLNQQVAVELAQLPLPVFDITSADANSWALSTAEHRALQAQRFQHRSYRTRTWPAAVAPTLALQSVRGWLHYQGF